MWENKRLPSQKKSYYIMSSTEGKKRVGGKEGDLTDHRKEGPSHCSVERLKGGYVIKKHYLRRTARFHELHKWNIKMPTNSDPCLIDPEQNSKSSKKEVVRPRDRAQSLVTSETCWMASCPLLKGIVLHSQKIGRLGSLHYPLQLKTILRYFKIFC